MVSSCVRSAHPLRPVTRWLVPPRIHPAPIHRDTADTTTRGYAADLPRARDRDLDLDPDSDPDFVRGSKASLSVTGYFCCFVCVCVCACPTTRLLTFFFFLFFFFCSFSLSLIFPFLARLSRSIYARRAYTTLFRNKVRSVRDRSSVVNSSNHPSTRPSIYPSIRFSVSRRRRANARNSEASVAEEGERTGNPAARPRCRARDKDPRGRANSA